MILLLACAYPQTETAAFYPATGTWEIAWDQTFAGDCELEDMSTARPESEEWGVGESGRGFLFFEEGYPVGCTLDGHAFTCSLGWYQYDWSEFGGDALETITSRIVGSFTDGEALVGQEEIEAECEGDDCGVVADNYGRHFTYPCTAEAPFSGRWRSPEMP